MTARIETRSAKFFVCVAITVLLFFFYNLDIVRIWVVRHSSMVPTLFEGDRVVSISCRIKVPEIGDIVVARSIETGNIIKRVARVETAPDGTAWYYLLGDNPEESYDSRHFGPFPSYALRGTVVYIVARSSEKSD